MNHHFSRVLSLFAFVCFSFMAFASDPGEGKLTEKQAKELAKYTLRTSLLTPLENYDRAPNRFDHKTIYMMGNFKIHQKITGGYLIGPIVSGPNISEADFGIVFLKTSKQLPEDSVISGAVVYNGDFKYKAINGFDKSIASVRIPVNLPLSVIRMSGDPFTATWY